jgi:RND family efflux transporter MFP subunit
MTRKLDLKSLARRNDRDGPATLAPRRHIPSRYVLPTALIGGFVVLMTWSARDAWLPRQPVTILPVHVTLAEVRTAGTPLFKAAGWIEPRPTPIRVAALASGVVKELLVVEDQFVEAGQPIARLVDEDARLALAQAEATLRVRQSEVQTAEAALAAATTNLNIPAHLEAAVAEAEAALRAVETELSNLPNQQARAAARLRLAEIDLEAKRKAGTALSGLALQQSQAEYDAAAAEVRELEQRLPVLRQQREALARKLQAAETRLRLKTDEVQAQANAEAVLAAARARVAEAEVAVAQARLRLERMTIFAPVAGRILDLVATPGALLMEGTSLAEGRDSNTVVTMYCPDQLQVRVDVRFEDLPRVGRDQPVEIRSPAVPKPLTGKVLFLTGFANIQKNTLEVKTSLETPPEVLKPEMLVDVTFLAPERPEEAGPPSEEYRMFIPRQLVEEAGSGPAVWVADTTRRVARRRNITLGERQTPALVEVVAGLDPSSRLIVSGREGLTEGARIDIRGEEEGFGGAPGPAGGAAAPLSRHPL